MITPRVGHPAKEGLRHITCAVLINKPTPQSRSSSKRGIKTCQESIDIKIISSQSGSSSKRGIKTFSQLFCSIMFSTQSGSSSKRGIKTVQLLEEQSSKEEPRVGHPAKEGLTMQCFAHYITGKSNIRDAMHRDFFNPYHVFYKRSRIRSVIYCVSINHYPSCTSTNMMYLVFTIHL